MSTLKLKVLSNGYVTSLVVSSLIWVITSVVGSAFVSALNVTGMLFYQLIILSLAFSLPAQLVLWPAITIMLRVSSPPNLRHALVIAALSCTVVTAVFLVITNRYPIDLDTTVGLLAPYTITSLITVPYGLHLLRYLIKKIN